MPEMVEYVINGIKKIVRNEFTRMKETVRMVIQARSLWSVFDLLFSLPVAIIMLFAYLPAAVVILGIWLYRIEQINRLYLWITLLSAVLLAVFPIIGNPDVQAMWKNRLEMQNPEQEQRWNKEEQADTHGEKIVPTVNDGAEDFDAYTYAKSMLETEIEDMIAQGYALDLDALTNKAGLCLTWGYSEYFFKGSAYEYITGEKDWESYQKLLEDEIQFQNDLRGIIGEQDLLGLTDKIYNAAQSEYRVDNFDYSRYFDTRADCSDIDLAWQAHFSELTDLEQILPELEVMYKLDNGDVDEASIMTLEYQIEEVLNTDPIDMDLLWESYGALIQYHVSKYFFMTYAYDYYTGILDEERYGFIVDEAYRVVEEMKVYFDHSMVDELNQGIAVIAMDNMYHDVFFYDAYYEEKSGEPDLDAMWENYVLESSS